MISLKDIHKIYTSAEGPIDIFHNLSREVPQGSFVAVMGPSGAGKSTLLNIISGLDTPTSGEILVDQKNLSSLSVQERTHRRGKTISFIFQAFHLLPHLTVKENVELPIGLNNTKRRYDTDEILEKVGLSHRKNAYPFTLSGGEQQRVAIARAFIGDTPILLADEPTGNLDERSAERIMNLITGLHKESGTTIVMITHDERVAQKAQKQYRLEQQTLHLL